MRRRFVLLALLCFCLPPWAYGLRGKGNARTLNGAVISNRLYLDQPPYNADCTGVTSANAALSAAATDAGTTSGATIVVPDHCTLLFATPGGGGAVATFSSNTAIEGEGNAAIIKFATRTCHAPTYLIGAACPNGDSDCVGGGGGSCVYDTGSSEFAPTGGTAYTFITAAASSSNITAHNLVIQAGGTSPDSRCNGGSNDGKACHQVCSNDSILAGGACETNGGCVTGTCLNTADCHAGGGNCSTSASSPGTPSGPGKIDIFDFGNVTGALVRDIIIYDQRQGDFAIKVGPQSLVDHVKTDAATTLYPSGMPSALPAFTVANGVLLSGDRSAIFDSSLRGSNGAISGSGNGHSITRNYLHNGDTLNGDGSNSQFPLVGASKAIDLTGNEAWVERNKIILAASGTGISVSGGGGGSSVRRNRFTIAGTGSPIATLGITLSGGENEAISNTIPSQVTTGITFTGANNQAQRNKLTIASGGTGILATSSSSENDISKNRIAGSPSVGIDTSGFGNRIAHNYVSGLLAAGFGIRAKNIANDVSFNIISGVAPGKGTCGMYFDNQQDTIIGNYVTTWFCRCGDPLNFGNYQFSKNICYGGGGWAFQIMGAGAKDEGNYLAWRADGGHCAGPQSARDTVCAIPTAAGDCPNGTCSSGTCSGGSSNGLKCANGTGASDCPGGGTCTAGGSPDPHCVGGTRDLRSCDCAASFCDPDPVVAVGFDGEAAQNTIDHAQFIDNVVHNFFLSGAPTSGLKFYKTGKRCSAGATRKYLRCDCPSSSCSSGTCSGGTRSGLSCDCTGGTCDVSGFVNSMFMTNTFLTLPNTGIDLTALSDANTTVTRFDLRSNTFMGSTGIAMPASYNSALTDVNITGCTFFPSVVTTTISGNDARYGDIFGNVGMQPGDEQGQTVALTRNDSGTLNRLDAVEIDTANSNSYIRALANSQKAVGVEQLGAANAARGKVAIDGVTTCNLDGTAVTPGTRLKVTSAGVMGAAADQEPAKAIAMGSGTTSVRCYINALPAFTPPWYGKFHIAAGNGDPYVWMPQWTNAAVGGPTPTQITTSVARCVNYRGPTAITVNHVRLFGNGATTNLYNFAIYPHGTGANRTWTSGTVTTSANTWLAITANLPITLAAATDYWFCVSAVATGTTAGFYSLAAPVHSAFWAADAAPLGGLSYALPTYVQFAVTTGAMPSTLPAVSAAAFGGGSNGSVPFAVLDNS